MDTFAKIMQELLQGFGTTALLFAVTLVISIPLGLIISLGSLSKFKPLKWFCRGLVWVIRGTPLLLQILFISSVPNLIFSIKVKDFANFFNMTIKSLNFTFVSVAFSINYACYFSEIFRGGIQSINVGQYEAGKVLGMTKFQIFFKIILLQVFKRTLAPTSNEVITLVKDTSLASILGVVDLFTSAQNLVNDLVLLTPLFYSAIFYLIFNGLLTLLFSYVEKKFDFYRE